MATRLSTGLKDKLLGQRTNLLSNGTFDVDAAGWTANGATLTSVAGGQNGNALEVAASGAAAGGGYQDVTTVAGRVYRVKVAFQKGTAASGRVLIGDATNASSILDSGPLSDAAWADHNFVFIASAASHRITLQVDAAAAGETALFDEVVIEEVFDGFRDVMGKALMNIYSGPQPASADDPASGTLLATISLNGGGGGFVFGDAVNGQVSVEAGQTLQGTAVASGTAGWFRVYNENDDPAVASTVAPRFDGAVATSGAELNLSSTSIAAGAVQSITNVTVSIP